MENKEFNILGDVARYYESTLATHGQTPLGVDWNGPDSQRVRFEQLTRAIIPKADLSVIDLGCGYGALFDYLSERFPDLSYQGYDICRPMIDAAMLRLGSRENVSLNVGSEPSTAADYALASGIFNICLERKSSDWHSYIISTLDTLHSASRCGFAFNALTIYSDPRRKLPHLHYSDPCVIFDYCKRHYSNQVALLHDYGLFEFTIIVRK